MASPVIRGQSSNFNIGVDRFLTMTDESGGVVFLGKVTDFQSSPEVRTVEVAAINDGGRVHRRNIQRGWKGVFTIARETGVMDYLQAVEETRFYTGQPQRYFHIDEVTSNEDGSVDEFMYYKCNVRIQDAGSWQQERSVDLKFEFECEQRVARSALTF